MLCCPALLDSKHIIQDGNLGTARAILRTDKNVPCPQQVEISLFNFCVCVCVCVYEWGEFIWQMNLQDNVGRGKQPYQLPHSQEGVTEVEKQP